MVTLNVKKITENVERALKINFDAAPDVSKIAQRYTHNNNEIIINSRRIECCLQFEGYTKNISFKADTIRTTKDATNKVASCIAHMLEKFNIAKIVKDLESNLNFKFDLIDSNKDLRRLTENRKSFIIRYVIPWQVEYLNLDVPKSFQIVLTPDDVEFSDDAVKKISEFLIENFNCIKAPHRDKQIDEILAD